MTSTGSNSPFGSVFGVPNSKTMKLRQPFSRFLNYRANGFSELCDGDYLGNQFEVNRGPRCLSDAVDKEAGRPMDRHDVASPRRHRRTRSSRCTRPNRASPFATSVSFPGYLGFCRSQLFSRCHCDQPRWVAGSSQPTTTTTVAPEADQYLDQKPCTPK